MGAGAGGAKLAEAEFTAAATPCFLFHTSGCAHGFFWPLQAESSREATPLNQVRFTRSTLRPFDGQDPENEIRTAD